MELVVDELPLIDGATGEVEVTLAVHFVTVPATMVTHAIRCRVGASAAADQHVVGRLLVLALWWGKRD